MAFGKKPGIFQSHLWKKILTLQINLFMFARQVKIEGTHYPALTFLVDSLRNEGFAHSDPSREAELLFPGMKELSLHKDHPKEDLPGKPVGCSSPSWFSLPRLLAQLHVLLILTGIFWD